MIKQSKTIRADHFFYVFCFTFICNKTRWANAGVRFSFSPLLSSDEALNTAFSHDQLL
jgi:hypothetical protein